MQMAEVLINCFPETPLGIISLSNTEEKLDKKRIEIGTSILTAKGLTKIYLEIVLILKTICYKF